MRLFIALTLLIGTLAYAGTKKVYLHEMGTTTEVQPTLMGGASSRQTSFLNDVLHYWQKTKECSEVIAVLKSEGTDYEATLVSDKVGFVPRVSYTVSDKEGKVLAAKTVSPKNVAKDICKVLAGK